MTKTTKTSTARKSIVAGLACALALAGAVAASAPKPALANDGTVALAQKARASHWEGEKVTIYPGTGGPVYAEWHKVGGRWAATFYTYNWTRVCAYPSSDGGWNFWVNDGGRSIRVVRTPDERIGPKGTNSHWREADGIARY
jgi:hypothetical protein